ncbi:MAG: MFS transporter [Propionibacterium sp.]|nr:MFS transporter [Propionibacterium sp.]
MSNTINNTPDAGVPDASVIPGEALQRANAPKRKVFAWALWDWSTQPFATVITTFVFGVYLVSSHFGEDTDQLSINYGWAMAAVGVAIALLAPVLGQGSDRRGNRMRNLFITTMLLAVISASLYFVQPDPGYFWLGVALLGVGNVVAEIANVNYYAAIDQVSTPENVGRVSGLGWGLGYLGGITILLLIVLILGMEFAPDDIRIAMVFCGVWTVIFSIPIFIALKDRKPVVMPEKVGVIGAYKELIRSIVRVWRTSRHTLYFLIASAVFRDGLGGVFTYGAILASVTFGFTGGEVIIFGIVANLTAGISSMLFGMLDDRIGPKNVIMISLVSMVLLGLAIFFFHDIGKPIFWVCGLLLTLFVGPAQAASRSYLARLTPEGHTGEIFGLYATTGRAVSFLSSTAWALSIGIAASLAGGAEESVQYAGILGIVIVLAIGLVVLIPVKDPTRVRTTA